MITEDDIRGALDHGAAQAPDPDGVLAALERRTRRARRYRTGLVATGTALVAMAALLPGLLTDDRGDRTVIAPIAGGGETLYGPAWLPTGFREVSRSVSPGTDVLRHSRVWSTQESWDPEQKPQISLIAAENDPSVLGSPDRRPYLFPAFGTDTERKDRAGRFELRTHRPGQCTVAWTTSPRQLLVVKARGTGDDCATAHRVAESVRRDPSAAVSAPIRIDRPLSGTTVRLRSDRRVASGCVAWLELVHNGPGAPSSPSPAYRVEYGHGALPEGGTPLTIDGRPARYYPSLAVRPGKDRVPSVAVELGGGRRLLLHTWVSVAARERLTELAGRISVGEPPTCAWSTRPR